MAVYDYFYLFDGVVGATLTPLRQYSSDFYWLLDLADGSNDGRLAVGDPVIYRVQRKNNIAELLGRTETGDPVLQLDNGTRFILSHNPNLVGTTITSTVTDYRFCFAAGTLIATASGQMPVEDLTCGDLVRTADDATVPVRWIGRQTIHNPFEAGGLVRLRAGSLGEGLPHADLTVTADHGMVLDGLVINASALVNGDDIDWVPSSELPPAFTVYHVETEAHDVILANGAPAETFIDYRGRRAFDNFDEYLALYGAERIIPEMPRPRISARRMLPEHVRNRLGLDRAAEAPDALTA